MQQIFCKCSCYSCWSASISASVPQYHSYSQNSIFWTSDVNNHYTTIIIQITDVIIIIAVISNFYQTVHALSPNSLKFCVSWGSILTYAYVNALTDLSEKSNTCRFFSVRNLVAPPMLRTTPLIFNYFSKRIHY